jgi:hypothetical protein
VPYVTFRVLEMNLREVLALLDVISDFSFQASKTPNFTIYDDRKGGYNLLVKKHPVNDSFHNQLRETVKSRNLLMREAEGYVIIKDH